MTGYDPAVRDRGSALLLVPSGVLILVMLSAIVLDGAVAFLAQREVSAAASSTANDLATLAIDHRALHHHGRVELDPDLVVERLPELQLDIARRLSGAVQPGSLRIEATVLNSTEVLLEVSAVPARVVLPMAAIGPQAVSASAIGRLDLATPAQPPAAEGINQD